MKFLVRTKNLLCLMLLICSIACSSKDDSDGNTDGFGDYQDSPLSPDEHKAKLESIGKDFVAKINAQDHETALTSLNGLVGLIDDSNFEDCLPDYSQDRNDNPVSPILHSLKSVIEDNDIQALVKSVSDRDEYKLSDFQGIYTYANGKWTKTSTTEKKMELTYSVGGVSSVLTAAYSGVIKQYDKIEETVVDVPEKMDVTLKVNGKTELTFVSNIKLADDKKSVDINVSLTLSGDYVWTVNGSAKSDVATLEYKMTVKGEELMVAAVELTGTKLTDPDYIENNGENADEILNTGKFNFKVMNLNLIGSGDISAAIRGIDAVNEKDGQKEALAEAKVYNDYIKIEGFYVEEKQKFADVKMDVGSEERERYTGYDQVNQRPIYEMYTDYYTTPVFMFTDGSKMEFESFFTESRFSSLISAVEKLINTYADMIGEDRVEL